MELEGDIIKAPNEAGSEYAILVLKEGWKLYHKKKTRYYQIEPPEKFTFLDRKRELIAYVHRGQLELSFLEFGTTSASYSKSSSSQSSISSRSEKPKRQFSNRNWNGRPPKSIPEALERIAAFLGPIP